MKTSNFPVSTSPIYNDYIVAETDDALIFSDLELPDQDSDLLKAAFLVAIKFNIKHLIIAGDMVATDQATLTEWAQTWVTDREATFPTVIEISLQILHEFGEQCDSIYMIEGNHDDRVARKTGGQVFLGMFLAGTKAKYSRYAYMYIKTRRGMVKVCHPSNFSANSVALGQKLYNVSVGPNEEKCHIILGHTHQMQSGFSPDGTHEIHALGCMRDPQRTRYLQKHSTTYPQWSQGFLLMRGGYFYPLSKYGTNWKELLGEFATVLPFA